jgi:hypothetical protein
MASFALRSAFRLFSRSSFHGSSTALKWTSGFLDAVVIQIAGIHAVDDIYHGH